MYIKRTNKILVIFLVLLLALSVGYALFSETITINGTATAKGNFAFEIETMKGINEDIKTNDMYALLNNYGERASEMDFGNEDGVEESSISHTTNTITFSAAITNQGQSQYFTAKITNTGSIPMMFDIYYDFQENASMTGNVIMEDGTSIYYDNYQKTLDCRENIGLESADCIDLELLKLHLTSLYDVFVPENIYNKLNTDFDNGVDALPVIEPGKSIYLIFNSSWKNHLEFVDENIKGIDMEGKNTITLPVKQYTGN